MRTRLEHTQLDGFEAFVLENDALRLVVLPELGGKIVSLQSRLTGREWLWRNPHLSLRRPLAGVDDFGPYDSGGWDEIFPTVNCCEVPETPWGDRRLTDHGELWYQHWRIEFADEIEDGSALLTLTVTHTDPPFQFSRTLVLPAGEPRLELSYELVSHCERPLPYIWAAHPLLTVTPGDNLLLRPGTTMIATACVNLDTAPGPLRFDWPNLPLSGGSTIDVSQVPEPSAKFAIKLFAERLIEGSVKVMDSITRECFAIRWDPAETPHVGLWLNYGAWSGAETPNYFNVGVEPTSSPHDDLAAPIKIQRVSKVLGTRRWSLAVALESPAADCN